MANNARALQWFLHGSILVSSGVFLPVVPRAAHTAPSHSNFPPGSFLLSCPRTFPCHLPLGTLSPSQGMLLGRDTGDSAVERMPREGRCSSAGPQGATGLRDSTTLALQVLARLNPISSSVCGAEKHLSKRDRQGWGSKVPDTMCTAPLYKQEPCFLLVVWRGVRG